MPKLEKWYGLNFKIVVYLREREENLRAILRFVSPQNNNRLTTIVQQRREFTCIEKKYALIDVD